jgi:NTP pyrophosphatase (non-canonical NTP hydrolase)
MEPEWKEALLKKNFIPIFDMPFLHSGMSFEEFLTKTKRMSKIQSIPEYQGLAARTCPSLPGEHDNERHMNLGVITEIGEVLDIFKKNLAYGKPIDVVNLGEELADISWYIVNKCRFHEIPLDDDFDIVKAEVKQLLDTQMFTEQDLSKEIRAEALMHPILQAYCGPVNNLFSAPIVQLAILANIAEWFELDFFQVLTNNIDKLKVRYPEKFTEEAAQNRDLEAERAELEKE